eukprot:1361413-Pyramimonas_sp.AAC.1
MHLSLHRLGWVSTSALTLRDDKEREIHVGYTSPSMLDDLLDLASQRAHERALAEHAPGFGGDR